MSILDGRLSRLQYIKYYFMLVMAVISCGVIGFAISYGNDLAFYGVMYSIAVLGGLAAFVLDARRFHDMGKAAVWAVIPLLISLSHIIPGIEASMIGKSITVVGSIIFLYLCFVKGDEGNNQYGAAC